MNDMKLKKGDIAPDFALQDTTGKNRTLSDFLENENEYTLLLFFPLAFSSVCTEELCTVRDNMKLYIARNANIIGISVDSFFTLREFKKSNNLQFSLLSDFNKEVSSKYDVLYEDYFGMKGVSKRSVFIIDHSGEVQYAEVLEDSGKQPDFKAIQQTLLKN